MAYYPDLSPFGNGSDLPRMAAVGWLDPQHPFTTGDPGREVFERLKVFCEIGWEMGISFGRHYCEFCRYPAYGSRDILYVPGDGITYATPEGIVHYIATHEYCPPREFCEAVLKTPCPDTREYFVALRANGWPEDIASDEDAERMDPLTQAFKKALNARGRLLSAGVEVEFARSGRYPDQLPSVDNLASEAVWTYSHGEEGYLIEGEWRVGGLRLTFDSRTNQAYWELIKE